MGYSMCISKFVARITFLKNILQISELQEDVKRAGMLTTKQCTYLGEFNGILKNGIGICIYPHGDKYTGFWKEDKYHGQ